MTFVVAPFDFSITDVNNDRDYDVKLKSDDLADKGVYTCYIRGTHTLTGSVAKGEEFTVEFTGFACPPDMTVDCPTSVYYALPAGDEPNDMIAPISLTTPSSKFPEFADDATTFCVGFGYTTELLCRNSVYSLMCRKCSTCSNPTNCFGGGCESFGSPPFPYTMTGDWTTDYSVNVAPTALANAGDYSCKIEGVHQPTLTT